MDGFEKIVYQAMGKLGALRLPFRVAGPTGGEAGASRACAGAGASQDGQGGRAAGALPRCTSNFGLPGYQVLDWRVGTSGPTPSQGLRFPETPKRGDRCG